MARCPAVKNTRKIRADTLDITSLRLLYKSIFGAVASVIEGKSGPRRREVCGRSIGKKECWPGQKSKSREPKQCVKQREWGTAVGYLDFLKESKQCGVPAFKSSVGGRGWSSQPIARPNTLCCNKAGKRNGGPASDVNDAKKSTVSAETKEVEKKRFKFALETKTNKVNHQDSLGLCGKKKKSDVSGRS